MGGSTGRAAWALATSLAVGSCREPQTLPDCVEDPPAEEGSRRIETGGDPVLLAAGDIIDDHPSHAEATAELLDRYDGQVATLGDSLNTEGRLEDLLAGYASTWGRHRWRTRPSVGNHDYMTSHAAAYYAYFCAAAGTPFDGWYSYDLGAWHIVVLNSMCADYFGEGPACSVGSPQLEWLAADLAAHPSACLLAYFHHPRFSSDADGDHPVLQPGWDLLYRAGAELVLNGHAHTYERFAPMAPDGTRDDRHGIRELIVGTGGAALRPPPRVRANSEVQITDAFGIARLTLRPTSYEWQFIDTDGRARDEGSASCH